MCRLKDVTFICLVLYVDDMVIAEEKCEIEKLELLGFEVEMKDLGASMKILRMEIFRDREKRFFLSQKAYSIEVLTRFVMSSGKSISTFALQIFISQFIWFSLLGHLFHKDI